MMNGNRSMQGKRISRYERSDRLSYETDHSSRKRKNNEIDNTNFEKRLRQEKRNVDENLRHLLPIKRNGKVIWRKPAAVMDAQNKRITGMRV